MNIESGRMSSWDRWLMAAERGKTRRRRPRAASSRLRRGTVALEFACVAPLILVFFFAAIEFGRGLMAIHGLETASREACRIAVAWNPTNEDIESAVAGRLSSFGISDYALTIEPDPPTSARQWEPVSVRITVPYAEVSWLPLPRFLQTVTLNGSCTLPQESDQSAS